MIFSSPKTPVIMQSEHSECGLACIAMIAAAHGAHFDLRSLRQKLNASSRGLTLSELLKVASQLHLAARPLSMDLAQLDKLSLPAVLHWDFNHFVVLTRTTKNSLIIHDPAVGRRIVTRADASLRFTGIALEFSPTRQFRPVREVKPVSFSTLIGNRSVYMKPAVHAIVLSVVIQTLIILMPYGLQIAVDRANDGGGATFTLSLCLALAGVVAVQAVASMARGLILSFLGTTLHYRMMLTLFRHLLSLPATYFAKRSLADVISRFDSLRYIQRLLSQGFLEAVVDGSVAIAIAVVMLFYDAWLALLIVAGLGIYGLMRHLAYDSSYQAQQEMIVRTANYQSHFMETVRGIIPVKLSNRTHVREAGWNNSVVFALKAAHESNRWTARMSMLAGTVTGLLWIVTIWFCARAVQLGDMTAGMVAAFIAWQQMLVGRGTLLIDKLFDFRMLHLHRGRVADISEEEGESNHDIVNPGGTVTGRLELVDVSFQFDADSPMILDKVSLSVAPGDFVAIVAPSGEGKTTLLKIMLGLLRPTSGEVRVDGVSLEKLGVGTFREAIAAVMQEDLLFSGSIMDNIGFFDPSLDFERVRRAAQLAAVDQDVEAMPMGYHTLVGDMGAALSGGQRQRILLARALYRNPTVLFLDEATSHLDSKREKLVNHAVSQLGITRVIAAHRKETIEAATRVVTLSKGRLKERLVDESAPLISEENDPEWVIS